MECLRFELAASRWKRWKDYIASGKSELVIDEFEKYSKIRTASLEDMRLKNEALENLGVLRFPGTKTK